MKLPKRQADVLKYITSYYKKERVPPAQVQIQEHFGWASLNSVQTHIRALEKKGLIQKTRRGYIPA